MNYDPVAQLVAHVTRIFRAESFQSDSIEIMRKTRLVLERENCRDKYPILSMYCDWVQHTELDRNSNAWLMLERVDRVLVDYGSVQNMAEVHHQISNAIGLPVLRREFIGLFQDHAIRTDIFDSFRNWKQFLLYLLDDLSHRPLTLSPLAIHKKGTIAHNIFERMRNYRVAANRRPDMAITRLFVSNRSDESGEPGRPPGVYWHLQACRDNGGVYRAELNGVLELGEQPSDFKGA